MDPGKIFPNTADHLLIVCKNFLSTMHYYDFSIGNDDFQKTFRYAYGFIAGTWSAPG